MIKWTSRTKSDSHTESES